jgi:carotenoid cleavage dioxygenase
MRFESTVDECIVTEGEIPKDLAGGFYRNGPAWKRPTKQGTIAPLTQDGMIQSMVFHDGRADYKNRWVRTPKYLLEEKHRRGMFEWVDCGYGDWRDTGFGDVVRDSNNQGVPQSTAGTNVFPFAGDMIALHEQGGPPIALDPLTLETKGIVPWSAKLSAGLNTPSAYGDTAFAAHPKWDHTTGDLFGWTWRDEQPYLTMHVVHKDGSVDTREIWDAPYATVAHDAWLTQEWVVMAFQPFIADRKRVTEQKLSIWGWKPEMPIHLALIPRNAPQVPVRWIKTDLEPQYIMHTMSANVVGNQLLLDGPIFNRPPFPFEQDFQEGQDAALYFSIAKSCLGRWIVDLDTGRVRSEQLSDRPSELPKVDERFYGRGYKWGYQVGGVAKRSGMKMNSLVVTNMETLSEQVYEIRQDEPAAVMESTFAPRSPDSPEGDGYIIVPVSWWADKRGEYQIYDTHDITTGPICRIDLPFPIGWTPHGHWMDFR